VEKIISGHGRGKQLGFPTLNLQLPQQIIPAEGVYAGFVQITDTLDDACSVNQNIPAVFSVGQARTFGDDYPLLIEAHLLIENPAELAGRYMAMDFIRHIRTQHKFKTEKDLINQIEKDCKEGKKILAAHCAEE
jgi:riboflavin kinase/FMN adenylyltransferase